MSGQTFRLVGLLSHFKSCFDCAFDCAFVMQLFSNANQVYITAQHIDYKNEVKTLNANSTCNSIDLNAIELKGVSRYCPIKATVVFGSIILVCIVVIVASLNANIPLIYSSLWMVFLAMTTFLFLKMSQPDDSKLAFTNHGLVVNCGKRTRTISYSKMKIQGGCWVTKDGKVQPAFSITGAGIPKTHFGFSQPLTEWVYYWKVVRQPDIIISKQSDWNRVVQYLNLNLDSEFK